MTEPSKNCNSRSRRDGCYLGFMFVFETCSNPGGTGHLKSRRLSLLPLVLLQVCQYRCIVSYETPKFEQFALCILQLHNCRNLNAQMPKVGVAGITSVALKGAIACKPYCLQAVLLTSHTACKPCCLQAVLLASRTACKPCCLQAILLASRAACKLYCLQAVLLARSPGDTRPLGRCTSRGR
jgi:hypothetical protein